MPLMCLDLGGAKTGIIIVKKGIIQEAEVVITEKSKKRNISVANDDFDRTIQMVSAITSLLDKYKVKGIIAELPAGSQSARAAKMFGLSIGALSGITFCEDISINFFTPGDVKKGFFGNRTASKDDMINKAISDFNLPTRMVKGAKKQRREIYCGNVWFAEGTFEHLADAIGVWQTARKIKNNLVLMFG